MQSAYEEKLAELVADLKRKGMAEASSLVSRAPNHTAACPTLVQHVASDQELNCD